VYVAVVDTRKCKADQSNISSKMYLVSCVWESWVDGSGVPTTELQHVFCVNQHFVGCLSPA
jgi:hypothetical protein